MTCEFPNGLLELPRGQEWLVIVPELFQELPVCNGKLALGPERVLVV